LTTAASGDSRKVLFLSMALQIQGNDRSLISKGREDVVMDLSAVDTLDKQYFKVKEGTEYRLAIKFKVQNDVVSGL
jgi:Rho GDP-dissociation inhibitor